MTLCKQKSNCSILRVWMKQKPHSLPYPLLSGSICEVRVCVSVCESASHINYSLHETVNYGSFRSQGLSYSTLISVLI